VREKKKKERALKREKKRLICVIKKETIREIEREGEGMVEEFATHVVAPLDMTWLLFTPGGTLHSLQYIIISLAVKSA
jgi:hypothetical protein